MRFLLAGGGTGGHLFPGLSLADEITRQHPESEIKFVGTANGMEATLIPKAGYSLSIINAGRGSPLSLKKPLNFPKFIYAIFQSIGLLLRYKPDVVISLGGFAAAAPGVAAKLLGVKVVCLEQNTVPGRVTKLLSKWSKRVYLQFAEAEKHLTNQNIITTGSPLRKDFIKLYEDNAYTSDADAILIIGGSQGARRLNELCSDALSKISETPKIIHIAGANEKDSVEKFYAQHEISAEVLGFCDNMSELYLRARIIISRSGAGSIAEICAAGVPAILVPLSTSKDNHQQYNAESVAENGAALIINETTCTGDELKELISELWNDKDKRIQMSKNLRENSAQNAASEICNDIINLISED